MGKRKKINIDAKARGSQQQKFSTEMHVRSRAKKIWRGQHPHPPPIPPHLLTLSMGQSRAPLPKWCKVGMERWQCEEQVSCLSLRGGVGGRLLVEECWTGSS